MRGGKLVHRVVSPQQAEVLGQAIANHRTAKKLMQQWETETERLMDANTALDRQAWPNQRAELRPYSAADLWKVSLETRGNFKDGPLQDMH